MRKPQSLDGLELMIDRYGTVLLATAMKQLGRKPTAQELTAMIAALVDVAADFIAKYSTAADDSAEQFAESLRIGVSTRLKERLAQAGN